MPQILLKTICIAITLICSLIAGFYNTILWIFFIVVSGILVYFTYPNVYKYGIWLVGIYIFGALCGTLLHFKVIHLVVGGIIFEIIGIFMVTGMIKDIVGLKLTLKCEVPLGFVYLNVFSYLITSNIGMYFFTLWCTGEKTIFYYLLCELSLIFMGIHVLYTLQTKLYSQRKI